MLDKDSYEFGTMETGRGSQRDFPVPPIAPEGGRPVLPGGNTPVPPVAPDGGRPVFPGGNTPVPPVAGEDEQPVYPGENTPVPPIAGEDEQPVYPGDDYPVPPVAGEDERPVYPGVDYPVPPIAGEDERPVYPGDDYPVPPIAPEGGRPIPPIPPIPFPPLGPGPVRPNPPVNQFATVRFLNAATNNLPMNVSIDNRQVVGGLQFGEVSSYSRVGDGFRTVVITSASGPRMIFYNRTIPFIAGSRTTYVIVDTVNGLDLVYVPDQSCRNMSRELGCLRVANMSYENSAFDVLLYGGETVFRDVRFKEVTPMKQARPGEYDFYITNAARIGVIREIPIIVIGNFRPGNMANEPLLSFGVDIEEGGRYTCYIIGNSWSSANLRVVTVMD